ncbi:hypothetical protein B0H63DRAFT_516512 [Podospora didyma]|uniref:O-methyltransferase domain-containing protein n=1 Tax=Podospora didyma TaxID=330526 RepID=A0AAE0P4G1_9PEZI|nr:hypothetical protein B0H63DRAFT_516512 [Podospora didyma]
MSSNRENILALIEKIEGIIAKPETATQLKDDTIRRKLREAGRKLSLAMEVTNDTARRLVNVPLQLPLAHVRVEKCIFATLAEAEGSTLMNTETAKKTGVDPVLMKRLLRYYQSYDMIAQPGDDAYGANNITKNLANSQHCFNLVTPTAMTIPKFLRETGYINPTNPSPLPWHIGNKNSLPVFPYMKSHPEDTANFIMWMTAHRKGQATYLDALNFKAGLAANTDASTVLFVDVGGAQGHQCVGLRQRYPDLMDIRRPSILRAQHPARLA